VREILVPRNNRTNYAQVLTASQIRFERLSRAAATGIDDLFVEVHDDPEKALSDGANALRLDRLGALLRRPRALDALVKSAEFIKSA